VKKGGDMVLHDQTSQTGEGELLLGSKYICNVSYILKKEFGERTRGEKQAKKQQYNVIGELLIIAPNGQFRTVHNAAEQHMEFTLHRHDEKHMQVFLIPDSPDYGVFEILAIDS
jgi:hypothetical protein